MTKQLDSIIADALAGDGDKTALDFKGREVPWSYMRNVADAVERLLDEAGLGEAQQIGFVPRNRPAFAASLLALLAGRRTIIMAYAFQSPEAIAADLRKLNLPAVIADEQDWTEETIAALAPGALGISLSADLDAESPVKLVAGDPSADRAGTAPPTEQPVVELLTSGTTGAPKRSRTQYSTIETAILAQGVLDQGGKSDEEGDPGTVNFPISNISGIYSLLPYVVSRRLVLFQEKFDLDDWLAFVKRHRPTAVIIPPAGIRMMLDRPDIDDDALEGVSYLMVGTAAVDADSHRAFEQRFGVAILLSYGATEFCGAATSMSAPLHQQFGEEKFGSVGKPTGQNEVRIVDPDTREVLAAGKTGLIEVKVPMLGDDFIKTTDLGMLDEDGFLFHRGRNDGVIVRGGFKIMPGSIEAVINRIEGVAVCSVVGAPDRRLGEVPVAVIEMQPGRDPLPAAEVEKAIRAELPATNVPVAFLFPDALPRTPSLKIDLKNVKRLAAEAQAEGAGA
ncbi:AMP-dependent synthetase [Erythrobacter litoralis]|uniref:class I adenylate-forming enzyme family protein n=1 Tax=Erythrobacter litoralis TaxID=39960 RepID=UPI0024348D73|nr:fatty acid--CoA ligase family protein [Erythrobacter litoralis]MDG6079867.1 AMP-dependent synthetase [Erythrobacter litoralis]